MSDIRNRVFQYVVEKLLDLAVVIGAVSLTWTVVELVAEVMK